MDRLLLGRPCGLEEKTEEANKRTDGVQDRRTAIRSREQPDKNMSTPFFFPNYYLFLFIDYFHSIANELAVYLNGRSCNWCAEMGSTFPKKF